MRESLTASFFKAKPEGAPMIYLRDYTAIALFVLGLVKLIEMAVGEFSPTGAALVVLLLVLAWWVKPSREQRDSTHPAWDWIDLITDLPYLAVSSVIRFFWRLFRLGDNDPSL